MGWLEELARHPRLGELDARWMNDAQSQAATARMADASGFRCIAWGPEAFDSTGDVIPSHLLVEAPEPQQIWIALHTSMPRALWIPGGSDFESLGRVLEPYRGSAAEQPPPGWQRFRGLAGITREDFTEIESRLLLEPYIDSTPLRLGTTEDAEAEEPEEPLVSTFRTVYSGAFLTLECYDEILDDEDKLVLLVEVTYPPCTETDVVTAWNREQDTCWPVDIPVDVLAAMHDMVALDVDSVLKRYVAPDTPGHNPDLGLIIAANILDEPNAVEAMLRGYAFSEDLWTRVGVVHVAASWGIRKLLEELSDIEAIGELRRLIDDAIAQLGSD